MQLLAALFRTTRIWGGLYGNISTAETEAQVPIVTLLVGTT